jgi:hypothetical protein
LATTTVPWAAMSRMNGPRETVAMRTRSRDTTTDDEAHTCVVAHLIVGLEAPSNRVPFGLSHHEFNPSRNRRLSLDEPALASSDGTHGQKARHEAVSAFVQAAIRREGVLSATKFWSAFYEAC